MIDFWRTSNLGLHEPHGSYSKNCRFPRNGLSAFVKQLASSVSTLRVPMLLERMPNTRSDSKQARAKPPDKMAGVLAVTKKHRQRDPLRMCDVNLKGLLGCSTTKKPCSTSWLRLFVTCSKADHERAGLRIAGLCSRRREGVPELVQVQRLGWRSKNGTNS